MTEEQKIEELLKPRKGIKYWWQDRKSSDMPDYIKLNGKVFEVDDAISLGKVTKDCLPATKEEYEDQQSK